MPRLLLPPCHAFSPSPFLPWVGAKVVAPLPLSLSLTTSLSLFITHTLSLSLYHSLSHSHSLSLSLPLPLPIPFPRWRAGGAHRRRQRPVSARPGLRQSPRRLCRHPRHPRRARARGGRRAGGGAGASVDVDDATHQGDGAVHKAARDANRGPGRPLARDGVAAGASPDPLSLSLSLCLRLSSSPSVSRSRRSGCRCLSRPSIFLSYSLSSVSPSLETEWLQVLLQTLYFSFLLALLCLSLTGDGVAAGASTQPIQTLSSPSSDPFRSLSMDPAISYNPATLPPAPPSPLSFAPAACR